MDLNFYILANIFYFLNKTIYKDSRRTRFCKIKVCFIMLHNNKLILSHLDDQAKMCLLSSKIIYVLSTIAQRQRERKCLHFFNYLLCSSLAQRLKATMSAVKQVSLHVLGNTFHNRHLRPDLLLQASA